MVQNTKKSFWKILTSTIMFSRLKNVTALSCAIQQRWQLTLAIETLPFVTYTQCTKRVLPSQITLQFFVFASSGEMESVHAAEPHKGSQSASATKLGEPIQQAIPLLPPFQPSDPGWRDYHSSDRQAAALACSQAVNIPPVRKSLLFDYFIFFY